jgi:hypothetical protein
MFDLSKRIEIDIRTCLINYLILCTISTHTYTYLKSILTKLNRVLAGIKEQRHPCQCSFSHFLIAE